MGTISHEEELHAIEHGVWITPIKHGCIFGNRVSINRMSGKTFLKGNITWLISEFTKMKISYDILSEEKNEM